MTVEFKSFGTLIVNEKEYSSDIIIYPDGKIQDSWQRKEDHKLSAEDIIDLIALKPKIIITGTGKYGILKPDEELRDILQQKGIEFLAYPLRKAVRVYNKLYGEDKIGACFHLTC